MTDCRDSTPSDEPDPKSSPFKLWPVEGIPFKKGSEEDLAIKRILRWGEDDREAERRAAEEAAR